MSQDEQNNIKNEIKCSAKMEIIYRITNEDGTKRIQTRKTKG